MNEFLASLAGGALGAGAAVAVLGTLLRDLLLKRLEQRLERSAQLSEAELELQHRAAQQQVDNELAIYPALSQLVYRAQLGAREAAQAATPYELANQDLLAACQELTLKLLSYRIYLPQPVFGKLHRYKHLLQDFVVRADRLTRPETTGAPLEMAPDQCERVRHEVQEIETLGNQVLTDLQARMSHLQGPLDTTATEGE